MRLTCDSPKCLQIHYIYALTYFDVKDLKVLAQARIHINTHTRVCIFVINRLIDHF